MKVPLLDISAQNTKLRPEIERALGRVLDTNGFILGDEVAALESELAEYCGARHAIACASGTDALILALLVYDIGFDDEVITTPYSFFASTSSIARLGAVPIFVDIEPKTFNMDVSQVEARITDKTKAIMPIHLFGQCAEMDALLEIGAKHGIPIIEDAAQAIGSEDRGRRAGTMGAIGCFSFYPSKNLGGMGDGGFLTTNDDELAHKIKALRVHGSFERYYHKWVGLNSRLDGFQGAVLRVKLPHLDEWSDARKRNADRYREGLAEIDSGFSLPTEREDVRHIYNQFVVRVPGRRDELRAFLTENGIGSDIYYPVSLHLQECFDYLGYRRGDYPESELASVESLALPIFPEMTEDQQAHVISTIRRFFS
jgi:dTDP-4-amino-4,6-dideoxygalactose transaminase